MSIPWGAIRVGTHLIKVKSCVVDIESIATEDSGRTDGGNMEIEYVYNRLRKVKVILPPQNQSSLSATLDLVMGKTFTLTYTDPIKGETSGLFYCSNCSQGFWYNGLYESSSFNCIEVSGENTGGGGGGGGTYQEKSVTPSTSQQIILPDTGYDALSKVTVAASPTETKNITANGTFTPSTGKVGFSSVTVNVSGGAIPTYQSKTVTPNAAGQTVEPDANYDALSSVEIIGDEHLVAGNVKSGVDIFGVTGTYTGDTDFSQATAANPEVLSGRKYFGSAGTLKTGTMANYVSTERNAIGSLSTDSNVDYYRLQIPYVGRYDSTSYLRRAQTDVASDIGLTAGKIVSGNTVLGVVGTGGIQTATATTSPINSRIYFQQATSFVVKYVLITFGVSGGGYSTGNICYGYDLTQNSISIPGMSYASYTGIDIMSGSSITKSSVTNTGASLQFQFVNLQSTSISATITNWLLIG